MHDKMRISSTEQVGKTAFEERPGPPQGQNPCLARKRRGADAPLEEPGAKRSRIAEVGRKLYSARITLRRCDETAEPASSGSYHKRKHLDKEVGIGPSPPKRRPEINLISNTTRSQSAKESDGGTASEARRLGAQLRIPQIKLTKCDVTNVGNSRNTSFVSNVSNTPLTQPKSKNTRPQAPSFPPIRIMQQNMARSHKVAGEIRSLVEPMKLDVLLLQEPPSRIRDKVHTCEGLGLSTKYVASRDSKPWAAIAVTNPNLEVLKISQLCTPHCACAEIVAPSFSFYVVSQYFQFGDMENDREEHLRHLEQVAHSLRGRRLVIGMDCNAESSLWSPKGTNGHGANIEPIIQTYNLIVENIRTEPPTYETENGISYVDVTLSSQSMSYYISNWKVRRGWTSSDHNAIEIRIAAPSTSEEPQTETNRFNTDKADWKKFAKSLTDRSRTELEPLKLRSIDEVEAMAESLTGVLINACQESMPRKRRFRKSNPWWTKDLASAKREVNKAKRAYQRERDNEKRTEGVRKFRELEKAYKKSIKKTRVNGWREFATEVGNDEPYGQVYKQCANKLRPQTAISSLRTATGTTMGMHETSLTLLNAHIPDDSTVNDTPALTEIRESVETPPNTEDTPPFVVGEVKIAVRAFKNKKAPGADLVEVTVLKKAVAIIPNEIIRLLNSCLKHGVFPRVWKEGSLRLLIKGNDKDETDPRSYRPICLLSVIGKLFERLLVMRLSTTALAHDRISVRQYGFMKGRSTEDAIVELRSIVEASTSRYLLALTFDVRGAFDNVLHAMILKGLKDSGCQQNIYKVMQDYFKNRSVKVAWSDQEVSKEATKGCPQGSVMGPPCWNISFDLLLSMINEIQGVKFMAYADDLVVLIEAQSMKKLESKSQQVVNKVLEWSKISKLEISKTKTEGIFLKVGDLNRKPIGKRNFDDNSKVRQSRNTKPKVNSRHPVIKMGEASISIKGTVKYLGVMIDQGFGFHSHCEYLRDKVAPLFQKLRRVSHQTWGLNNITTSILYKACFGPTVAYAAAGWAQRCTVHEIRTLEAIQHTALLPVVHAYRTTSTEALCILSGSLPIEILLKQRTALYNLRKGRTAEIGELVLEGHSLAKEEEIKAEAIKMWQSRWDSSEKGRTTYRFFKDVKERLNAGWFRPGHGTAQVLTGHGNFAKKLKSFKRATDEACSCGGLDTAEHLLFDCPKNSDLRNDLFTKLSTNVLLNEAHIFVANPESYQIFTRFCDESLNQKPKTNFLENAGR